MDGLTPSSIQALLGALPPTQHLHRAIHRTGTALLSKRQIRHLRAFRMGVVKDGPDVQLFTHPGALTKLALWLGEALAQQEKDSHPGKPGTPLVLAGLNEARGVYVVVGTGGGGGVVDGGIARREREERKKEREKKKEAKATEKQRKKDERAAQRAARGEEADEDDEDETEEEDDDSDDDNDDDDASASRAKGKNRFGQAFQEVVEETGARVRIDSFEHCVMEVRKDDLGRFLEALAQKAVVG
jgi:cell division control protein 45